MAYSENTLETLRRQIYFSLQKKMALINYIYVSKSTSSGRQALICVESGAAFLQHHPWHIWLQAALL
jgi:hypothetical protein